MLVGVFANPHSVACRSLQPGRSTTFVKTHRAGFPLVNLTRHHVYWAERLVNAQLLRAPVPSSCPHVPVPRLLRYNDAAMRLTFEYVPRAPSNAIPDGSQILAQVTCLRDFLVNARVTHGDIECKHLLWARRSDAAHLMLVDFDMATFEYGHWNATVREAAIMARIKEKDIELVDGDVAMAFFYSEMYYQAQQVKMKEDIEALLRLGKGDKVTGQNGKKNF